MSILNAYIAANRFGFGAKPGELELISKDPRDWLKKQIKTPPKKNYFVSLPSNDEIHKKYTEILSSKEKNKRTKLDALVNKIYDDELYARTLVAANTDYPFYERLVHFWSNHFSVSSRGLQVSGWEMKSMVGEYERSAIRPHVTGQFKDMLIAVSHHPAMLIYLDNVYSVGDNSTAGKKFHKGLNENLAREILELHTLGVSGGYKQDDVINLAKIITGWSAHHGINEKNKRFLYLEDNHEPGSKTLLGKKYKENGEQEGIDALTDLAAHPSTAKFIATKLLKHFISDNPEQSSIDRLTTVFLESDGDLQKISLELLNIDGAWSPEFNKIKPPSEFILSAIRATGSNDKKHKEFILGGLYFLGQLPFNVTSPAGYSDDSLNWVGPEAISRRIKWAKEAGSRFETIIDVITLAQDILEPVLSKETYDMISYSTDKTEALALLIASPEFQKR